MPRCIAVPVAVLAIGCGRAGFATQDAFDDSARATSDTRDAASLVGVISMALGGDHTCVVLHDGSLWCWGLNQEGQLGLGDLTSRSVPTRVGTEAWVAVAAGGAGSANGHTCAIRSDASLWCWGLNDFQQLGTGGLSTSVPALVGTASWRSISCGWTQSCGIQVDGSLWCWGANTAGELGLGDLSTRTQPTRVGTRNDWQRISMGLYSSCALAGDASAWCWGNNGTGQVGTGSTSLNVPSPYELPGAPWRWITAIGNHTCGTKPDGSLWCWGNNGSGQLGLGDSGAGTERTAPTLVSTASWSVVGGSAAATNALDGDRLYRWGGQVFQGPTVPTADATVETWRATSEDHSSHMCAVTTDGRLYCWGNNADGQLGLGDTMTRYDPTAIPLALP